MQKFDVPIEATTSSLEALNNYRMGVTIGREKGSAPSIPFLKRAIELSQGQDVKMRVALTSARFGDAFVLPISRAVSTAEFG